MADFHRMLEQLVAAPGLDPGVAAQLLQKILTILFPENKEKS